jgi:hypothetical protein
MLCRHAASVVGWYSRSSTTHLVPARTACPGVRHARVPTVSAGGDHMISASAQLRQRWHIVGGIFWGVGRAAAHLPACEPCRACSHLGVEVWAMYCMLRRQVLNSEDQTGDVWQASGSTVGM